MIDIDWWTAPMAIVYIFTALRVGDEDKGDPHEDKCDPLLVGISYNSQLLPRTGQSGSVKYYITYWHEMHSTVSYWVTCIGYFS